MKVIATKQGGQMLLLRDGENPRTDMAKGFIYHPDRLEATEVLIQSALIRGYWDEETGTRDFVFPPDVQIRLPWGIPPDSDAIGVIT